MPKDYDALEAAIRRRAHLEVLKIREMEESAVAMQLGLHFRQVIEVRIRKPWWMPRAAYAALMRTIVIRKVVNSGT